MKTKQIILGSITLAFLIGIFIFWFYPPLHYNIHQVVPNKVYRSAELPAKILSTVIQEKHIRAIINLRNAHPKSAWWQNESRISKQDDIELYNLKLPAHQFPRKIELQSLTTTLLNAKRPLLIHCLHGADRSGLASAIVLILNNRSYADAHKQVSWRYFVLDSDSVGKIVLPYYQKWLAKHHLRSSRRHWLAWLSA